MKQTSVSESTELVLAPVAVEDSVARTKPPMRLAIDSVFQHEADVQLAITENLKARRPGSEAVADRVAKAFTRFSPSPLTAEDLARRHYVAPGADPSEALETVMLSGVEALRSSGTHRSITLRKRAELESLIEEAPDAADSLEGVVQLDDLVGYIQRKSTGASLVTEPAYTSCKAEREAEKLLSIAEAARTRDGGDSSADLEETASDAREVKQLVKETVNLQMRSATAPEARLEYASIPNSADQDKTQSSLLQTFQLRPGASDVTSYHDFHTLQIAFQHVWTQIFDGRLESLGRDLYREYVKLKDFSGSGEPDMAIGTLQDLRRLMEEIKKLSQTVREDIPSELGGGDTKDDTPKGSGDLGSVIDDTLSDPGKLAGAVATGGLSVLIEAALNEIRNAGQKPVLSWTDLDGRNLPGGKGKIVATFYNDAPEGMVRIALQTDFGSHRKILEFEPWDSHSGQFVHGPRVSNAGHETYVELTLAASQVSSGVLEFASQETETLDLGRYVLAGLERLVSRTRVIFHWSD